MTSPGTPAITVAISPLNPAAMVAGATQTFTATVSNDSANAGVSWTASAGTIGSSGLYTAATPVLGASATITATSKTDPTKSASVTVPLTASGSNTISVNPLVPSKGTLGMGGSISFNATVANDPASQGLSWSIGAGPGKLTAVTSGSVTYTSPSTGIAATTTVTLTATSIADPTKSATAPITLNPISVSITPTSASLSAGGSQSFAATVANDNSNAGVLWTVTGGGSFSATSTFSGIATNYTAPSPVTSSTVTITATSKEDPTRSASASVSLSLISLNPVSPSVATLGIGQSQAFSDTVTNDPSNAGVRWALTAGPGTLSSGSNSAVTYNAPTTVISSPTTATLTATSIANPSASTSVIILLAPIAVNLNTPSSITLDGDGAQTTTVSASITSDGTAAGATFTVSSAGGTISPGSVTGNSPSSVYAAPIVTAAKTSTITVASVTDPTQTQTVTVRLNLPMTFTTPLGALIAASTGTPYPSTPIVVAGGTGTKTFTVTGGALPAGLSLSSAGVISGTATASAGTYNFTTHVVDQSSVPAAINGAFSITVGGPGLTWVTPAAGTQTYTVGTPITPIALSATSGTGAITYSVNSGSLPQGLQIVGSQVTGTPTAPTVVSGNSINFLATDSATPTHATAVSANVIIVANPIALAITSTVLPIGTVGVPYSYQLTSTGGTGAITWSLSSGSLAGTGLALSSSGLLSGTPTAIENGLSLTFEAQDSATNQQQTKTALLPLNINNALAITTTSSLPIAIPNTAYNQSLAAVGGSGSGYTWTVLSGATGASSLATLNLSVSSAGVISGTPTTTGTANFSVQVKDSANNTASASLSVSTSAPLALPAPNPSSLGTAGITLAYSGAINATGGIAGYTWTVNSSPVPTNGSSVALSDGLSVSNSGGSSSLSVSGTPAATGTVSFAASVRDSTGTVAGPFTYTIAVSDVYTVGGSINTKIGCGSASLTGVTVSINTNPVQTTTTGANGSFSFSNVPNGTYTLTPSLAGAIFSPTTESVTVNNNNLSATSFTANLAYTVTGTVNYTGTQTGRIYLAMNPVGTCGGGTTGTSIPAAGPFTIRGVPPGSYTLQAFMDNAGNGISNASNPVGSTSGVNVSTANLAGASVTLSDPATVTLTTAPTLKSVSAFNNGAVAEYTPITDSAGVEMATYYTFQWSTDPAFGTLFSKRFPATGTHLNIWFLNTLTNGSVYYFRAYGTSAGTVAGPFSPVVGPVLIGAPTVGNVVTGSVSFAAPATGPLYTGFFDQGTGAFYGQYFAAPVSAQPYTIQVPTGSNYLFIGVVDQNNDGAIDTNDITNTGNGSSQPITSISGPTPNTNLTLPSANGIASVTTQNYQVVSAGSTSESYNLSFRVNGLIKQPVTVTLASGPNLITPVDIAICGGAASNCGQGFQITFNLNSTSPNVGDSYTFNVTYSDGTTGTLTAAVTAVLSAFPTNLAPQTGASVSTAPTFTWTDPINATNYSYQFYINDPSGNPIWNIPGSNSTSSGFSSATTSITWGSDSTGGGSTPAVGNLTLGVNYAWQITVQDSLGNTAATQVQYQP